MKFLNYIRGRSASDFMDRIGVRSHSVSFELPLLGLNN